MKPTFTEPKIVRSNNGWYVYFRYGGKVKTFRRGGNYYKNLKQKEQAFEDLRAALHNRLISGWCPLTEEFELYKSDLTLIEAVQFGLSKKKTILAPRTYESYKTAINYFIDGVKALHMDYLPIHSTKRIHIKRTLEKTKEIKGWSNKAYNKNMGYIKAVFGELIQWDIIENSPAYKIRKLKELETEANTPATDAQAKLIKEKLLKDFRPFWTYVATIFHTGIRPEELLAIQIKMINFETNTISLPPEITKTPRYRIVPINKYLKEMLLSMNVDYFPKEFYLFGTNREHLNRPITPVTDFIPGEGKLNRDCATELWKKLVKKELGISVNLYSYKHLGANKKILAGIELEALSELYGHTSKLMTMRYAKIVKEVYRNQIMQNSPDI